MSKFNLVDEPWIPVIRRDGTLAEVGIREALAKAGEIVRLADDTAPAWLGITRTLVAVLQRSVPPADDAAWARTVRDGWEQREVDAYLDAWHGRFDFLDSVRPWFQWPGVEANAYPAVKLTLEHAVGDHPALMDWSRDSDPVPLPFAEAARALVGFQACSPGGSASVPIFFSHAPGAMGANFVLVGRTLRETLAMALLVPDLAERARSRGASGEDAPSWELDSPPKATAEACSRGSRGYLDFLTWWSRRVAFDPPHEGRLLTLRNRQGISTRGIPNPWCASIARKDGKEGLIGIRSAADPAWLRAADVLAGGPEATSRNVLLEQARRGLAADDECLPEGASLRVTGLAYDNTVVNFYYSEELKVPRGALASDGSRYVPAVKSTKDAIGLARDRMASVFLEVRHGALGGGKSARKVANAMAESSDASTRLSRRLKPMLESQLHDGLNDEDYRRDVMAACWGAVREFSSRLGNSPRVVIGAAKSGL